MFRRTLLLFCVAMVASGDAAEKLPNIVVILADDFGVGDIQAHYPENKIATPHLDRLVQEGMSFVDAHSPSAVCSPTRYGLLTGRYAWRTRLQEWVVAAYEPPLIAPDRLTLPEYLRRAGYHTSAVGKWHLGWDWLGPQPAQMVEARNGQKNLEWDFSGQVPGGPTDRGFDDFFGVDLPNLPPFTFIRNKQVSPLPTERYVNDLSVQDFMPQGFEGCPVAPGWKLDQILPEITREAVIRVHELARQDKPFFLYFSQTSPHEPVSPSADFRGRSGINPVADFVMETDWSAGQVLQAIEDAGIADDTIVIFTADNGHSHYTGWQGLIAAGHRPSGEFRGHKGDIWEGGHRVPLVLRWPGHVAAGSRSEHLVSLTDVFATCVEVTGGELTPQGAEDSISFLPAALGARDLPQRLPLVSHSNHGEFACREGNWKIVFRNRGVLEKSRGQSRIVELYDLGTDVGETTDVAATHPERVQQMSERLAAMIAAGATRPGLSARNDGVVRHDVTQQRRWIEAAPE
jgi:arylsulfatase A